MLRRLVAAVRRIVTTARSSASELGQTTAEYALVILGAAALATLLITWATQFARDHEVVRHRDRQGARVTGGGPERLASAGPALTSGGRPRSSSPWSCRWWCSECWRSCRSGLVVRDQVAVIHAAREAARAASVDRDPGAGDRGGPPGAGPGRGARRARRPAVGEPITVEVSYHDRTDLPLVGAALPRSRPARVRVDAGRTMTSFGRAPVSSTARARPGTSSARGHGARDRRRRAGGRAAFGVHGSGVPRATGPRPTPRRTRPRCRSRRRDRTRR